MIRATAHEIINIGVSVPVGRGSRLWGDHCNYNSSGVVLHVGGNYNQNQNHGAFYLNGNNAASNANGNIGSRILASVGITDWLIR